MGIPILIAVIVGIIITVVGIMSFVSRNYIKVPPNKVAVFYGRKYKSKEGAEIGFKVLTGGAKMKTPIVENVSMLDLSVFSIDLDVKSAPNKDGVPVSLKGVANVKILSDETSLMAACERFLGMSPAEIKQIAYKNLEGHLRGIAGKMTIEALVGDRTALNQTILEEAAADLKKLGLGIDLLTIQEVTDESGYIQQLGKKRTAEVTKDADVGKAEAEKASKIATTTAAKEAAVTANANEVEIFQSDKDRDVKKQKFAAEVAKETAIAEQAGPLATAQARKEVVTAEQEVLKIETEKKTEVAQEEAKRKEQELLATVVKPAEADKAAAIAKAEGEKQQMIELAEGEKQKLVKEGEGKADAVRAVMLAEADGIKAKLLAEAEGIDKKAEAYKKLDEAGKILLMLDVMERLVPAAIKEFAGVMKGIAEPLGHVDSINIVDFGGSNGNGNGTALTKFGQTGPEMLAKFATALNAMGINPNELMNKLGIDPSKLVAATALKKENGNGNGGHTEETTVTSGGPDLSDK